MNKTLKLFIKFFSLFLALQFGVQTSVSRLNYLAPGQMVGGLSYTQMDSGLGKLPDEFAVDSGALASSIFPSLPSWFPLLMLVFITGCAKGCATNPGQRPNRATLQNISSVPTAPIPIWGIQVEFYGNTQGASTNNGTQIQLRRGISSNDNWGNALLLIGDTYRQMTANLQGEQIRGIRIITSGSGQVRVWLRTKGQTRRKAYMPTIGGSVYEAGQFIFISKELIDVAASDGGFDAVIIDRISGAPNITGVEIAAEGLSGSSSTSRSSNSITGNQSNNSSFVPLPLNQFQTNFYGNTNGASQTNDQYIQLNRNPNAQENWGNAMIEVRNRFSTIVNEAGADSIQSIRIQLTGSGSARVWLKTVNDHDAGRHMPRIGGQVYSVSSGQTTTIDISGDLVRAAIQGGGVHGIIVDLMSGSVRVSDLKVTFNRPVRVSGVQSATGPIRVYTPIELLGNEVRLSTQVRREILQQTATIPGYDARTDINWMLRNQNDATGLIKDTEAHTMSPNFNSAWSYVQGTALMRLVEAGELTAARNLARGLIRLQNRNGNLRGSWPRGWQWHNGTVISRESGVGETAWIAFGFYHLYLATGESQWLDPLYEAVHFIAGGQETGRANSRIFGSVHRTYDASGNLMNWRSIEHNIDAASLFYKMAHLQLPQADINRLTTAGIYHARMELFARARLVIDWMLRSERQGGMWTGTHFHVGYNDLQGRQFSTYDEPTDPQTWGLLMLAATTEISPHHLRDYASALNWILPYTKAVSFNNQVVYGFSRKPLSNTASVSSEFTYGFALAAYALSDAGLYRFYTSQALTLRASSGIPLSLIGPSDQRFPFNEPYPHMTAANWAYWAVNGVNPFEVPGFNRHANVGFSTTYPEEATLQAAIRALAPEQNGRKAANSNRKDLRKNSNRPPKTDLNHEKFKRKRKNNGGFIGRGSLASIRNIELLVYMWTTWRDHTLSEDRKNIYQRTGIQDLALNEFEKILEWILPLHHEERFFSDSEKELAGELIQVLKQFNGYIIPFKGSLLNPDNFMAAFSKAEGDSYYLGLNYFFIRYLSDRKNSELVTEVILHELLHIAIERLKNRGNENWNLTDQQSHQYARVFQLMVTNPDTVRSPEYRRKNRKNRARFWQKMINEKSSSLNKAILDYLNETSDKLVLFERKKTKEQIYPNVLKPKDLDEYLDFLLSTSL